MLNLRRLSRTTVLGMTVLLGALLGVSVPAQARTYGGSFTPPFGGACPTPRPREIHFGGGAPLPRR